MQRLATTILVASMTLSQASFAQKSCQTNPNKIKEACDKALADADQVIKKQTDLILTLGNQNESLKDENEELSNALLTLKNDYDNEIKNSALLIGGGALVGILIGVLIPR